MIRFPINSIIPDSYSEFHLNDQWTVECNWYTDGELFLEVSIKPRKKITSAEIPIFGTLSAKKPNGPILETSEFSSFLKNSDKRHLVTLSVSPKLKKRWSHEKKFCELLGHIIIVSDKCEKCTQTKSLGQLSNDFALLLDPQTSCFADVNLICGDVSMPAHKVILSARSPVFAAMFKNPMKESHQNEVNIDDIDASVLRTMVIYIYTGTVSDLTNTSATDLLVAADKYMMQDLKELCCDFLKSNLTLQHVLTILVSGGDILPECLKSVAMDYFSNKCEIYSSIENVEEWKTLKKENPALAFEVVECFLKSRE